MLPLLLYFLSPSLQITSYQLQVMVTNDSATGGIIRDEAHQWD